jgi:hypothetical protein
MPRNSLFVTSETDNVIREFDIDTDRRLQGFELPATFAMRRPNRGLESLTRAWDGSALWTANEEALLIDGPAATDAAGTTVRLLELSLDVGFALHSARQFAYPVEPVHAVHEPAIGTRSGLADLVGLPDGTLLALERSLAFVPALGLPTFESRVYEVDLDAATDVSGTVFDIGLAEQEFVPAGKELLWSGQAGGLLGQNLEGLTLGPQLEGGRWSLVGVVDDGDPLSGDTLVAFELAPAASVHAGDYNSSGVVEQGDLDLVLLNWGASADPLPLGWTGRPPTGIIDQDELDGVLLRWGAAAEARATSQVPEPRSLLLVLTLSLPLAGIRMHRGSLPIGLDFRSRDEVQ